MREQFHVSNLKKPTMFQRPLPRPMLVFQQSPRVGGATTERLDAVPPTPTNPSLSRPPPAAAGGREKGEVFGGPSVLACQSPFRRRRVGGEARNAPLRVVTWYISAGDAYRLGAEPNHGRRTINAGSGGHPAPRTRWHERLRSPGRGPEIFPFRAPSPPASGASFCSPFLDTSRSGLLDRTFELRAGTILSEDGTT